MRSLLADLVPDAFFRARLDRLLEEAARRPDADEIARRADYYIRLRSPAPLPPDAPRIGALSLRNIHSIYYYDARKAIRYFDPSLRWRYFPGDNTGTFPEPTVAKSRRIDDASGNVVLLPLNQVRHFNFVRDRIPFRKKRELAVFRGTCRYKPRRIDMLERLSRSPLCDIGDTSLGGNVPTKWKAPPMGLDQQLTYQFILAVEGNDVASNLKWVMSSNSLALMPKPTYETWYQEGELVPEKHYVEIAPDYSDIDGKILWYSAHPDAAQKILDAAHDWTMRFRDPRREMLISLVVMSRYFELTNPR